MRKLMQSGGGLPHSKTWRMLSRSNHRGGVPECAGPLALCECDPLESHRASFNACPPMRYRY